MPQPPRKLGHLPGKQVACYSLGAVGSNVVYALIATYLLYFYTESFGLRAAAVGTLLLVVRVWDGVMDVIMGITVDNTHTRWGKFRPYLLLGGVLTGVAVAACFWAPNLSGPGRLLYAYCTYIVWSISYTVCDIPYWSLTPAMTQNPAERTRVTALSRTGAQVGNWVIFVGTLPAVKYFGGRWAPVGVLAGGVCIACFVVAFLGVREQEGIRRERPQTLQSAARFFLGNRPLFYLMLSCLLLEAASNIRGAFTPYFFKYCLQRADLIPLVMAANITFVIIGCLCAPAITRWTGKVRAALYFYMMVGVAMVMMYFIGDNIPLFLVLTAVAGFFDGVSNIARMSCLADCVEYGEWKTGNRAEGLVFSVNVFKTKVASGLAGAIPAYLLALIGYVPNAAQSAATIHWITLFYTALLGVASIAAILPLVKYELHEHRFEEIIAHLHRRRASETEAFATDPLGHGGAVFPE